MARVKESLLLGFVLAMVISTVMATSTAELSSSVREVLARRKNLMYIKGLLQDLDSQLGKLQKRSCDSVIRLPDDHCDNGGIIHDIKEEKHWETHSPGKRSYGAKDKDHWINTGPGKRSCPLGLPGNCDSVAYEEIMKEMEHWDNMSPGRRAVDGDKEKFREYLCGNFVIPGLDCGGLIGVDDEHWDKQSPGK